MKKVVSVLAIMAVFSTAVFAAPLSLAGSLDTSSQEGASKGVSVYGVQIKSGAYHFFQPNEEEVVRGGGGLPIGTSSGGKGGSSSGSVHRLMETSEIKTIKGGSSITSLPTSTSSIGGKGGSYGSSDSVNITLNNVPYVNQHITNNPRSDYYCGLASALMVRGKDSFGYSAPTVPNVVANMEKIDNYLLKNNMYGNRWNGGSGYPGAIDVFQNKGLLYIAFYYSESRENQYKKSIGVLNDIYTARGSDGIHDSYRITGVDVGVRKASQTIDTIWEHINTFKQPVVVVVDSNIIGYMKNYNTPPAIRSVPTLHYIVIRGIRESSIWTRYFSVYDPDISGIVEYTSTQLKGLITMPDNTPEWVYTYPKNELWISDPCYRLLVYGN